MIRKILIIGLTLLTVFLAFGKVVSAQNESVSLVAVATPNPKLKGAFGFTYLRNRYANWQWIAYTGKNILIRAGIYNGPRVRKIEEEAGNVAVVPVSLPKAGGGGAAGR